MRAAVDETPTLPEAPAALRALLLETLAKGKTTPIAQETLQRTAALYAVEAEVRGKPAGIRRAVRQAKSHPLVEDLFAWLSAQLARLPGSSPTAQAIRYALNHREGLVRFLEDGRIELDTNTVERAIRPICLSRKNALFASGGDGGARWAAVASLVETCKLNGVDPQRYFTEVLTRLVNGWPNSRIDDAHAVVLGGREEQLTVKRRQDGPVDLAYCRGAAYRCRLRVLGVVRARFWSASSASFRCFCSWTY
jgi:transposase